jgi:peptide/nickel transport system substrate-binding protein
MLYTFDSILTPDPARGKEELMKARPIIVFACIAAAAVAGLVSRSSATAAAPTARGAIPLLRIGFAGSAPSSLDVSRSKSASPQLSSLVLEQLMQIGPDGRLKPWLAQSVTEPNATTYVYHLRRGVKFWDGSELTSADVANSLNYERYPGMLTAYAYASVRSVTTRDRYTVVVMLKHPDASWPYVPAQYVAQIFEKRFADAHKGTMGQPGVLIQGTGPWIPQSLDPTSGAELSANPHYWGGPVGVQHISVKFLADETSLALAFRSGAIDVYPQVGDPRAFAAASGARIVSVPGCQQNYLSMNTGAAPWSDVHVRRAVAYALNRRDIIAASGGPAVPVSTMIPPSQLELLGTQAQVNAVLKSLPQYPYDLAKARQEMARSAYPNGFKTSLVEFNYGSVIDVSQVISAQLKKIGIDATVDDVGVGPWVAAVTGAADKRPATFTPSGCNSPDPSFYTFVLGSKNTRPGFWNTANYTPPTVDALLRQGITTVNPARRLAIYGKLLQRLALDVPYVPLFTKTGNLAISSRFSWPAFNSTFFNRAWALEIKPG